MVRDPSVCDSGPGQLRRNDVRFWHLWSRAARIVTPVVIAGIMVLYLAVAAVVASLRRSATPNASKSATRNESRPHRQLSPPARRQIVKFDAPSGLVRTSSRTRSC